MIPESLNSILQNCSAEQRDLVEKAYRFAHQSLTGSLEVTAIRS